MPLKHLEENEKCKRKEKKESKSVTNVTHSSDFNSKDNISEEVQIRVNSEADSVHYTCSIPESFSFVITKEDWKKIEPKESTAGHRRLSSSWTDIFNREIQKVNPACVLTFNYNYVITTNSRKKHANYFKDMARCSFEKCATYLFTVEKEPAENDDVMVNVKVT